MITNIVLENFKCFRKLEVNPRLITVFIGPNGTGKSSVLQALVLLKQSIGSSGLNYQGRLLNLARPEDIVNKITQYLPAVRIEFGGYEPLRHLTNLGFGQRVEFRYGAEFTGTNLAAATFDLAFEFGGKEHRINCTADGKFPQQIHLGNHAVNLRRGDTVGRLVMIEGWAGEQASLALKSAFGQIIDTPCTVLARFRLVPPSRGLVRASYPLSSDFDADVFVGGSHDSLAQQTATNLVYSRGIEAKISRLLERVSHVGLRADMVPGQRIEPKAQTPAGDINMLVEGFGTSALILLLFQLADSQSSSSVMIEEPEIHLHPRAQAELASVLAEQAKAEDKQIIMTTHSEHILGRLLTLVAEKKLSKDELAVYSFEKDQEGVCTASEIAVTEDGRVIGGLRDFFESELAELDRYIKALQTDR